MYTINQRISNNLFHKGFFLCKCEGGEKKVKLLNSLGGRLIDQLTRKSVFILKVVLGKAKLSNPFECVEAGRKILKNSFLTCSSENSSCI
jgi:hypothetical protein